MAGPACTCLAGPRPGNVLVGYPSMLMAGLKMVCRSKVVRIGMLPSDCVKVHVCPLQDMYQWIHVCSFQRFRFQSHVHELQSSRHCTSTRARRVHFDPKHKWSCYFLHDDTISGTSYLLVADLECSRVYRESALETFLKVLVWYVSSTLPRHVHVLVKHINTSMPSWSSRSETSCTTLDTITIDMPCIHTYGMPEQVHGS